MTVMTRAPGARVDQDRRAGGPDLEGLPSVTMADGLPGLLDPVMLQLRFRVTRGGLSLGKERSTGPAVATVSGGK